MKLDEIVAHATNKAKFLSVNNYIAFCSHYLEFVEKGLQARIVSQNESHYQFFQYRQDGSYNITRPLNALLMYDAETFTSAAQEFTQTLEQLKDGGQPTNDLRQNVIRTIYTIQQSIGTALDALPAGMSNQARKVNGDLFERFIRLLIVSLEIDCVSGTMQVPVKDANETVLFKSSYQHDLLISKDTELKIIGSVKTSSKD